MFFVQNSEQRKTLVRYLYSIVHVTPRTDVPKERKEVEEEHGTMML